MIATSILQNSIQLEKCAAAASLVDCLLSAVTMRSCMLGCISLETYHRKNMGYFDEVQKQQENKLKQPRQIRYCLKYCIALCLSNCYNQKWFFYSQCIKGFGHQTLSRPTGEFTELHQILGRFLRGPVHGREGLWDW